MNISGNITQGEGVDHFQSRFQKHIMITEVLYNTPYYVCLVMQSKKILYSAAEETPKAIPIREEGPKVPRSLKDKISTIGRTTTQNDFCFMILPNYCVLLPGFIRGEQKGKPKPVLPLSATERGFKLCLEIK